MNNSKIKVFLIFTIIFWAGFIFFMSSKNADNSSTMSEGFTKTVMSFFPRFNGLEESAKNVIVLNLQFIVRKTAHASVYFILGVLASSLSFCYPVKTRVKVICSSAGCLLYAISDEIHQIFIPGRSSEIRDIMIDFCGALAGIGLTYLIRHIIFKHSAKKHRSRV